MYDQSQSPLFLLPGEIRNEIYKHCLTSCRPIIDPSIPGRSGYRIRSRRHHVPPLGSAILRACQRAFYEVPANLLYTHNVFRFTTSTHAHWFFIRLTADLRAMVKNVEIDLYSERNEPSIRREWYRYLAQDFDEHCIRLGTRGSLRVDAPTLQTLSLDIGTGISWEFLESVLEGPHGLGRIVVRGDKKVDPEKNLLACSAGADDNWIRPKPFTRALVISTMASCVSGDTEEKLVKWEKINGQINLEIVNKAVLTSVEKNAPLTTLEDGKDISPMGLSTLVEFEPRQEGLMGTWELNPISA